MKRVVVKAAAAVTLTLMLQPCFSMVSLANTYYESYYDDDYDYWRYDGSRKLLNSTEKYDDGTKYTADYKYDEQGNLIYSTETEPDGSKTTRTITYQGGGDPVSISVYEYDAATKSEKRENQECSENGRHVISSQSYPDGIVESVEIWYNSSNSILKSVNRSGDGIVVQTENAYDENDFLLTSTFTSSDGKTGKEEWKYDEAGETVYHISYEHNAATNEQEIYVRTIEGEGDNWTLRESEKLIDGDGSFKTIVSDRNSDGQLVKRTTSSGDGYQCIENYVYNESGFETLYTSQGNDGSTIKRETRFTRDGYETIYSDSNGDSYSSMETTDSKNGKKTSEMTYKYKDGSSYHVKNITLEDYTEEYYITENKYADGTSTYSETVREADGSVTRREGNVDGSVTEIKYDDYGNIVSSIKRHTDGTYAQTAKTFGADGSVLSEVTQYSDGGTDRIDYVYGEDGDVSQYTETKRNGISALVTFQYTDKVMYSGTVAYTFNNGYQVILVDEHLADNREQTVITYSGGEIASDTLIDNGDGSYYLKTVHRDGRAEEFNLASDADEIVIEETLNVYKTRFTNFLEQAWGAVLV